MELIDQSFEIWGECPSDPINALKWVEKAGRECYRSSNKISDTSYESFIQTILKPDPPHSSVLEHSNIVATRKTSILYNELKELTQLFAPARYLYTSLKRDFAVWGNLRAFMERLDAGADPMRVYQWLAERDFIILPVKQQQREQRRITVKLVTDRAVLAEITRHRDDTAFSVQSQRYVSYKDGVAFIKPSWWVSPKNEPESYLVNSLWDAEMAYQNLQRDHGLCPQDARVVLPNQTATIIVMTAYLPQWEWIFKLRTGAGAYPQMRKLMQPLQQEFILRGWL
jgi:thymidylate synthase ThyX